MHDACGCFRDFVSRFSRDDSPVIFVDDGRTNVGTDDNSGLLGLLIAIIAAVLLIGGALAFVVCKRRPQTPAGDVPASGVMVEIRDQGSHVTLHSEAGTQLLYAKSVGFRVDLMQ